MMTSLVDLLKNSPPEAFIIDKEKEERVLSLQCLRILGN